MLVSARASRPDHLGLKSPTVWARMKTYFGRQCGGRPFFNAILGPLPQPRSVTFDEPLEKISKATATSDALVPLPTLHGKQCCIVVSFEVEHPDSPQTHVNLTAIQV